MRVILNSDVLVNLSFTHGELPEALQRLCQACCDKEIVIVVPRTTQLEFDRRRNEYVEATIRKLKSAYDLLDRFSIIHDAPDPAGFVVPPDLLDLIAATGARVEVDFPSIDDFNDAHERASLHHPPRGGGRSDEMRDLTIWAQALRVAREQGGAVIVAGDAIFHDDASSEEADRAGLIRVKTIDAAIEEIRPVQSPAVAAAARFVESVRADLQGVGLPFPPLPIPYMLSDVRFTMGDDGNPSEAHMRISYEGEDQQSLQANVHMFIDDSRIRQVSMSDIRVGGETWGSGALSFRTDRPAPGLLIGDLTES